MRIKQWNEDINLSFLGGYILLSMALIAIDCRNITTIFPDFSLLRIPEFSMFEMMTFHFQTMFLASAMIGYLISKVDTRIMGLSIKYLILKRQIFSLNFVTCFLLLLITGFFAILGFIFSARCFLVINMLIMFITIVYIIYFAYIVSSKKSIIYRRIMDAIRKNRNLRETLYDKWESLLLGSINEHPSLESDKATLTHDSYIVEELLILQLLRHYPMFLTQNRKNLIRKMARYILSRDPRDFEIIIRVTKKNVSEYLSTYEEDGLDDWLSQLTMEDNN